MDKCALCCKAFALSTPLEEIVKNKAKYSCSDFAEQHIKSIGVYSVNPVSGYDFGREVELYTCDLLGTDGRCIKYESRPFMCTAFCCLEYVGQYDGCESLNNGCTGKGQTHD